MESETVKGLGTEVFSDEQNVSSDYAGRAGEHAARGQPRAGGSCTRPGPKAWREAHYLSLSTHSVQALFKESPSHPWQMLLHGKYYSTAPVKAVLRQIRSYRDGQFFIPVLQNQGSQTEHSLLEGCSRLFRNPKVGSEDHWFLRLLTNDPLCPQKVRKSKKN